MVRRTLVAEVGGCRPDYDGSQDHDLILRITERTDRILHIPKVLYLWRILAGSAAGEPGAKQYAVDAGRRAVEDHCRRVGIEASVEHLAQPGAYRVRRVVRGDPLVSVVIPSRGSSGVVHGVRRNHLLHALRSVTKNSSYENLEFVVVADLATPPEAVSYTHLTLPTILRV